MAISEEKLVQIILGIARAQAQIIRAIGMEKGDTTYTASLSKFLSPTSRDPSLEESVMQILKLAVVSPAALDSKIEARLLELLQSPH